MEGKEVQRERRKIPKTKIQMNNYVTEMFSRSSLHHQHRGRHQFVICIYFTEATDEFIAPFHTFSGW